MTSYTRDELLAFDFDALTQPERRGVAAGLLELLNNEGDTEAGMPVAHWVAMSRFDGVSPASALKLYERIYECGDPAGAYFSGGMLLQGDAVEQNLPAAFAFFQKGAANDHPESLYAVADCHLRGIGTPQDFDAARRNAELAVTAGNAEANYLLGAMFVEGLGVEAEPAKGLEFLLKAVEAGSTEAREYVNDLEIRSPL